MTDAKTVTATTLTDTLGTGLELVAGSIVAPDFSCNAANPLVCTLSAGAAIGTHTVTYKARVTVDAGTSVSNTVSGAPCATGACTTDTPVAKPGVSVSKQVDKTAAVSPGDTLTYTIGVTVTDADLIQNLVLVDTLSGKQTFAAFTSATGFTCPDLSNCVLPAGTVPGTYQLVYTTTVDADATGSVGNSVVATGGDPVCTTCTTTTPVVVPSVTVNKSVDKTGEVKPGDTLTYTIEVVVGGSALTQNLVLVDTLSGKQTFAAFTSSTGFSCPSLGNCVLPAGTLPGTYEVVYTTTVDADATGSVGNSVVASGGDPECVSCTTTTPVIKSVARVSKSVAQTQTVRPGDVLDFTLVLSLELAANAGDISLIDTLGEGLEFVGVTNAGAFSCSRELTCILAAGHLPGQYTVTYQARVAANAGAEVRNTVVAIEQDPNSTTPSLPGDPGQPLCETCQTITPVAREVNLRISKVAAVREARIGDLVRYTLEVENLGDANLVNGVVIDTAPAGFSLVADSLVVIDGDNAAQASSGSPTHFTGIDIAAGQKAQLVYLMRVGAGVRNGVQVNRAQVRDVDGNVLSNEASAQVTIAGDPLLEDSLLLGTVFDDRNGDGRQASARLSEVFVQGGFDAQAYIANSTTIERDGVREPLADASSPLLHGVAVGTLVGRSSSADNGQAGTVVIRQRLREPAFTGDFTLRSRQGLGLTMGADGQASISRQGDAADGLSSAELQVERRVSPVADGVEVAYVIRNTGIDERGIPGVRIASVEGLLMETDQFGRYHLVGISAGEQARGRNHVLKVDPSTLPAGAQFTTDNPLLRRITPGMPARFDFGVRLPAEQIGGRNEQVELEMGQVLFAPGASTLQPQYLPVIEQVAQRVRSYDGGEVVIAADGEGQVLAMARAEAVQQALQQALGAELSAKVQVQVRSKAAEAASTVVGLQGEDLLLGTVLFDTDKAVIKPEFEALLDAVAARLQQRKGGTVAIVGHTDVRGSHAYNAALGLRRARAVHEALMRRLSPDVRDNVRVDASSDTTAPIDAGRE
ncbi:OmpA family protein [Stenotrophomonas ginsengisoli]|uniref:OmpA family protein n=1 Tax=Stenotrophomonas ginsengisoli TaxID=336566 RepID=UPI00137B8FC0|nr:OmpA family protein [Stenotrophomonas ginsengisoli]